MAVSGLEARQAPLAMAAEEFRAAGHRLVDEIAGFLESLAGRPVNRDESPSALRKLLPPALGEQGTPPGELLAEAAPLLFEHSLFNGHPRFFGYITAAPAPIGMLADLIAAAANPNLGS